MTKETNTAPIALDDADLDAVTGGGVIFIPILGSKGPGNVPDQETEGLTPGLGSSRGD